VEPEKTHAEAVDLEEKKQTRGKEEKGAEVD